MADSQTNNYIKGILNGDPQLINEIYENYHQAILKLVQNYNGTAEDARDVFQEGLMLIYRKAQQPDFQLSSSFFTYFYAICRNIWSNQTRKKSFGEVTLNDEMKSMVKDDSPIMLEQNEQYILYRKKFLELGEDCQQLLSLFLQKISLREIAKKMGLSSEGYAKKKKYKCKEKLITLIQNDPSYKELAYP